MVVMCVETHLAAGILPGLFVGTPADGDSITSSFPATFSIFER